MIYLYKMIMELILRYPKWLWIVDIVATAIWLTIFIRGVCGLFYGHPEVKKPKVELFDDDMFKGPGS